jgi:fucose 4-O-acetylase-like acetyltransferase
MGRYLVPVTSRRDPWLDNTKMVLVTLVVVGHSLVLLLPVSDLRAHAYDFLYYFHIPVFVMITGYLSRSFRYSRRHLWSVLTTLILPYVVFSWLMTQFRHDVGGEPLLDAIWTDPRWPMWYLVVLAMWRLATPLLKRHWLLVPASVLASLVAGSTNLELFDLNRALGLLPFFVIGLHLPTASLKVPQRRGAWLVGLLVLAGLWWFAARTDQYWSSEWLYYRTSYGDLGTSVADGMTIRLRLIGIALIGSFAMLTLVPRRHSWLSQMGAYTMVVYLIHGFVLRLLNYQDFAGHLPDNPTVALTIAVGTAVALALLLAWPPVAARLNYVVDPINSIWPPQRPAPSPSRR